MNKNLNRRNFIAASALAGFGLAACGKKEEQPADGSTTTSELTTVSFVLDYSPNVNHTGLYVAIDQGYFAAEGIDVEIVPVPADGADALIGSGGANMGVSYTSPTASPPTTPCLTRPSPPSCSTTRVAS